MKGDAMEDLPLTKTEFKALSSESRTSILKALAERNYTLSELSAKLGMSAPTIKEHAGVLVGSGMIELRDEGRKWKYYVLTRKGRDITDSRKKQVNILLILSAIGAFIFVGLLSTMLMQGLGLQSQANSIQQGGIPQQGGTGSILDETSAANRATGTGIGIEQDEKNRRPLQGGGAELPKGPATEYADIDANAQKGAISGTGGSINDTPNTGSGGTVQTGTPFTYQNSNCTPNFVVIVSDTSTNISEQYADLCYQATEESACRAIDYYNASTEYFGEGDGLPDCEWKQQPN